LTVRKRGGRWYFDFQIKGQRYREAIPEATTKWQAEQAENKARTEVFDATYGIRQLGTQLFAGFVKDIYIPWAKINKRTWRNDQYIANFWCETLKGQTLRAVSPFAIEKTKRWLAQSKSKRGTTLSPASVNMHLAVLSRIFTLAVELEKAASNPCRRVKLLRFDNRQYRYLHWEEETALMAVLENPIVQVQGKLQNATLKVTKAARGRLRDAIVVALGTGLRRSEQLRLQPQHCDFTRNVIIVMQTKTYRRPREVPMNDDVRRVLSRLCSTKRLDEYLFVNPKTDKPFLDHKKGLAGACADAGIEHLTWRNFRDTFGTRLGEAGYNAFDIAALMGHSDIRTTQRYVRVEPRKHEAVQATMLSRKTAAQLRGVTMASQTPKQPPSLVAVND
jgi:integrase